MRRPPANFLEKETAQRPPPVRGAGAVPFSERAMRASGLHAVDIREHVLRDRKGKAGSAVRMADADEHNIVASRSQTIDVGAPSAVVGRAVLA